MKVIVRITCLFVFLFWSIEGIAVDVEIPDPNLRTAIESQLGKGAGKQSP